MSNIFDNYVNNLMQNGSIATVTESSIEADLIQSGGASNVPNGGFPPIYECEPESSEKPSRREEEKKRKQEFAKSNIKAVSIHEILQKRKVEPFMALTEQMGRMKNKKKAKK